MDELNEYIDILKSTYNVSSEAIDKLHQYHDLVLEWNSYDLITIETESTIWKSHILDSAQLIKCFPTNSCRILDIGSGGGFPGLILSILTNHEVHLVERDSNKCAFLNLVINNLNLNAKLHKGNLENMSFKRFDYITARRFQPVSRLLLLSENQHHKDLRFLLLRKNNNGASVDLSLWENVYIKSKYESTLPVDSCVVELQFKQ